MRGARLLVAIAATTIILPASVWIGAHSAYANSQPPLPWSWYVQEADDSGGQGSLYTAGCNQAASQNQSNYNAMVILDFGSLVNDSGYQEETPPANRVLQPIQVDQLAEWYLYGYGQCGGSRILNVALGTNNSNALDYNKGVQFGNTVNVLNNWVLGYDPSHERVFGANDIETWSGTENPTEAYNWYNGYKASSTVPYVNFGSADGCPTNLSGPCSYGWGQGDYYNLSWGLSLADVAPEIYVYPPPGTAIQAQQWAYISSYGAHVAGAIIPEGPLDEWDLGNSTNTATQAWGELNFFFPSIAYSMEVHRTTNQ